MITLFRKSTRNLLTLLENLLTWSRMQQGLLGYIPQVLQVEDIVNRSVNVLAFNAAQKQITLHSQIQQELKVYADLYMLDTVIRNLLTNAIKFTVPGGAVAISAVAEHPMVMIAVTDTGIGIPEEKFAALFRIDAKYRCRGTAGERGTGLGLILCKEFIEKQGGTIGVQSVVGKGATFFFTIPGYPINSEISS